MTRFVLKQINFFLNLSRSIKQIILILSDILLCFFAIWLSYCLRLEKFINISEINFYIFILSTMIFLLLFYKYKVYLNVNRYFEVSFFNFLLKIFIIYGLIYFLSLFLLNQYLYFPRSIGIFQPVLFFIFTLLSRLCIVNFFYLTSKNNKNKRNVMIYGSGDTAVELSNILSKNSIYSMKGFISDNNINSDKYILNLPIYKNNNLNIIKEKNINDIFICIPNLKNKDLIKIRNNYSQFDTRVLYTPSYNEFLQNNMTKIVPDNFEPDLFSLLNRKKIPANEHLLKKNNFQKNILITGAGGSIGSELSKQICSLEPKKIFLLDSNEYSLFELKNKIESLNFKNLEVEYILGNILDSHLLNNIFDKNQINTVYHAAAYKHVSIVEQNSIAAIKNNIIGTKNLCSAIAKNGVENFVFISTDKAVKCSNIMGASKRACEIIVKIFEKNFNKTKFSIVRFGNVLASSGSVVNIFLKQISTGGPVTLTDKNVTRYFMTLNEAAELVIQAGALGGGSQVFILDMGEPIKIYDILKSLCKLHGIKLKDQLKDEGDITCKIIGLKPGEKMHEELFYGNQVLKTENPKILMSIDDIIVDDKLEKNIDIFCNDLNYNDIENINLKLFDLIKL